MGISNNTWLIQIKSRQLNRPVTLPKNMQRIYFVNPDPEGNKAKSLFITPKPTFVLSASFGISGWETEAFASSSPTDYRHQLKPLIQPTNTHMKKQQTKQTNNNRQHKLTTTPTKHNTSDN